VSSSMMLLKATVILAAAGLAVATLFALSARLWWAFDLFSHFRVQYLVLAVLFGALALAVRAWPAALVLAVVALIHGWAVRDLWLGGGGRAGGAGVPLRVVAANVLRSNPTPARVQEFVAASDADLVVLVDAQGERWRDVLSGIGERYPNRAPAGWRDGAPVVLFSRHPILEDEVVRTPGGQRPHLLTEVEFGNRSLTVAGVHPESPSPRDATDSRVRNRQLDHIADSLARAERPAIVTGDFNTTYWSPHFRDLVDAADLRNAAAGQGYVATWPRWLWPARIPLDHILFKGPLVVGDFRRGPSVGSDHFPVVADFRLATD